VPHSHRPDRPAPRRRPHRPRLELLEDRTVLSPLQAGPLAIQASEGLLYNGAVTTFTDANKSDTAANFTATITWGDTTNSQGTITGSNGRFTVSGQHTYAEQGNFPMSVLVQQDNGVSLNIGGPPAWTPLAANLAPAVTSDGAPVRGRAQLAAAAGADGTIYAIGGLVQTIYGGLVRTDEVDAYNPASQTWTQFPSLPSNRWALGATTGTDGTIYAIGGLTGAAGDYFHEADAYNPTTRTWTRIADLPNRIGVYLAAATGADGTIYAIGGFQTGEVDAYNPQTQTWTVLPPLPSPRGFLGAVAGTDGTIYAIGGTPFNGTISNEVDAYNPSTQTWTVLPSLPSARYGLAAAVGKDGTIYAIGGSTVSASGSTEVDAYNPVTQTWTVLGQSLPNPREMLAAATGADGTIYAMGGDNFSGDSNEVDTYLPPGKGANTATVADPAVTASGTPFTTPGPILSGQTVATFTDPAGAEPLGDYGATIDWGDQSTPTGGSITYDSGTGQFTVQGSHTYAQNGAYSITVTIAHESAPPATVSYTAQIGNVKPTASITGPTTGVTGQSLTFTVSATDPIPSLDAAGFDYTLHWGDGSQDTTVPASAGNGSGVPVGHAFPAGTFTVQVTATDQDHNSGTASLGVTVSPADTTTAVSASASAPAWGQNVTFTATVMPVAPGGGTPTGPVTFYDGSTALGTATLQVVNGIDQAVFSTSALEVGGHTITAFYGGDGNYNASTSGGVAETVGKATPAVTWDNPADITYGTALGAAQLDATANVPGSFAYTPGAGAVLNAGPGQVLSALFTPGDTAHYGSVTQSVVLTVRQASTATALAVSAPTPLAGVDAVALTASVTITAPGSGALTGSVDFYDVTAGKDLGSASLVNGVATLQAGPFAAGAHALTATYSGDPNFFGSSGTASLTALAPASLSGTVFEDFNNDGQVDFGEQGIGGVSITLTGTDDQGHAVSLSQGTDGDGAYVFLNLRPGSYYLTKATQPSGYTPGIDSVGTAGGKLSAGDQFFVQLAKGVDGLNYNYGGRPAAGGPIQGGQTAGIGFWNNTKGQALILALNGGAGTQLGDWLAATLPDLYGQNAGANDLAGKTNADVAALFQRDFLQKGQKLDAQVLATALAVYATNATLDSTQVAAAYGFTVRGDGVGTASVNVGSNGAAFGAADNTTMTVLDLLLAADAQAVNGVLYGGNAALRNKANNVFSAVNQAGAVG
jgi:hypothetical protein